MNLNIDPQLSFELQELYLRNKQWLSDIMFLEDESRFFQKLFNKVLASTLSEGSFEKVNSIDFSLHELEESRNNLRELVRNYQHGLEAMVGDKERAVGLELMTVNEINSLVIADRQVKKELYTLVEAIIRKDKNALLAVMT